MEATLLARLTEAGLTKEVMYDLMGQGLIRAPGVSVEEGDISISEAQHSLISSIIMKASSLNESGEDPIALIFIAMWFDELGNDLGELSPFYGENLDTIDLILLKRKTVLDLFLLAQKSLVENPSRLNYFERRNVRIECNKTFMEFPLFYPFAEISKLGLRGKTQEEIDTLTEEIASNHIFSKDPNSGALNQLLKTIIPPILGDWSTQTSEYPPKDYHNLWSYKYQKEEIQKVLQALVENTEIQTLAIGDSNILCPPDTTTRHGAHIWKDSYASYRLQGMTGIWTSAPILLSLSDMTVDIANWYQEVGQQHNRVVYGSELREAFEFGISILLMHDNDRLDYLDEIINFSPTKPPYYSKHQKRQAFPHPDSIELTAQIFERLRDNCSVGIELMRSHDDDEPLAFADYGLEIEFLIKTLRNWVAYGGGFMDDRTDTPEQLVSILERCENLLKKLHEQEEYKRSENRPVSVSPLGFSTAEALTSNYMRERAYVLFKFPRFSSILDNLTSDQRLNVEYERDWVFDDPYD